MSSATECDICCETFNKSTLKRVSCPSCPASNCRTCTRMYLINSKDEPHCMSCKNRWERDIFIDACLKTFVDNEWRSHRGDVLVEDEMSRMSSTMPAVDNYKVCVQLRQTENEIKDKVIELKNEMNSLRVKQDEIYTELRVRQESGGFVGKDKRVFIKKCPGNKCKGFLSSKYKCELCGLKVCAKCFAIKDPVGEETKQDTHVCNENDILSAELIKKETRHCPNCATDIFKTEGCFEKGTPILLWDGTTKMVEDIKKGDKLVGTDGMERVVKETTSGEDKLYTVQQTNGVSYTVNSKHTLLLKPTYFKKLRIGPSSIKVWWFDRNLIAFKSKTFHYTEHDYNDKLLEAKAIIDDIDESSVRIDMDNYLKLNDSIKKRLYGFKSQKVCWDFQQVDLDPYILGSWLGDGYSDGSGISGNDTEVIQKWMEWASDNDGEIVHSNPYRFSVRRKGAGYKRGAIGSETNCPGCVKAPFSLCETTINYESAKKPLNSTCPLKDALKKYKLLHNKHIPKSYLMNDRSIRLKLLAGIVDTDGCLTNNEKRITIIQVNKLLSEQICVLARSLGFVVNMRIIRKLDVKVPNCDKKRDYKDQCSINISGEHLSEIPTVISRKLCTDSHPNKDHFKTSIQVSFKEVGRYYGFMVDKDNEFILPDFTSVKNCDQMWCTQCQTPFSWKTGLKVRGTVHNPHFYAWQAAGGVAPVAPGAVLCGGLPPHYNYRVGISTAMKQLYPHINMRRLGDSEEGVVCMEAIALHRATAHFEAVELARIRLQCNEAVNHEDLRIRYIMDDISSDDMKATILKRYKRKEKAQAILEIYELVATVFTDSVRDIYQGIVLDAQRDEMRPREWRQGHNPHNIITRNLERCHSMRAYANKNLAKVSVTYSQAVGIIYQDFYTLSKKYKRKDLVEEGGLVGGTLPKA